jgi:hypothetical protein
MFKGLIAAIEHVARNIACLESTMSDVRELLIEKKQRDGRRNRKGHADEAATYAAGLQPKPEA